MREQKIIKILLPLFMGILAYNFQDPDGFYDVGRYYGMIERFTDSSTNILEVIAFFVWYGYDFLYYTFLFLFKQTPLGMEFFTGVVVFCYYYILLSIVSNNNQDGYRTSNLYMWGVFAFPNFIWVIEVSRTCFALIFFFVAVDTYIKGNKRQSFIFFILMAFTHIGSLMFAIAFLIAYYIGERWLINRPELVRVLCLIGIPLGLLLIGPIFQAILHSSFLESIFGGDRYAGYLEKDIMEDSKDNLSWVFKLQLLVVSICTYLLMNCDNRVSIKKIIFLFLGTIAVSTYSVEQNYLYRWMMVLPFVYVLYLKELIDLCYITGGSHRIKITKTIRLNSVILMVSFILMLYGTRNNILVF